MTHRALTFGPFEVRPAERVLLEEGTALPLGSRALDVLVLLVERAGQLVSKEELIAHVWPSAVVEEATLRVHIAALRKCLREGRSGQRYIANVTGRGYSFVAPVVEVGRGTPAPPVERARGLPVPQARVIGRDAAVAALAAKIALRRFVTVVGPGGVGKTAVALQAAGQIAPGYPDGTVFVDLAAVAKPALVPSALASALGLPARQDDPSGELIAFLGGRRMLLVLDSCERVVEAAAALTEAIAAGAPGVHLLATSREPLRAHGEWVTRLGPLAVPPDSASNTAEAALHSPAVQLFVECAAAALDAFELNDANADLVATICRRLDGMPLAIELAAARVDALGLQGILALLGDRLRLLSATGRRMAQHRHRTLQATLDWSFELLTPAEQALLRRMAVFAGAFTLEAALAGTGAADASELTDMAANLVAKSLLVADLDAAETRFRLLDTTRAYAWQKLVAAGEAEDAAQRHATYCRDTFRVALREADTRPVASWLASYAPLLEDVRAALDWAFATPEQARLGVELTLAAVPLWNRMLLVRECQANIERAIASPREARDVALDIGLFAALGATVSSANLSSPQMSSAWTRALELAERTADRDHQLQALWGLWVTELNKGRFRAALELARRFCTVAADAPDPNDARVGDRLMAYTLHFLGDQAAARTHIERMLAGYVPSERQTHAFRFQFDQLVIGRMTLALVLWLQGYPAQARQSVAANVEDALAIGHPLSLCNALVKSCCPIALLCGDLAAARRYVDLLVDLTRPHSLFMWHPLARCCEGLLILKSGDLEAGRRAVRAALEELPEARFAFPQTWAMTELALADARCGALDSARATIGAAIARAEQDEEQWCYAELLRVRGEIVLLDGTAAAHADAQRLFERARDIARRQAAPGWELRIATSLARLLHGRAGGPAARAELTRVLGGFGEGFDTADLVAAREMLALH